MLYIVCFIFYSWELYVWGGCVKVKLPFYLNLRLNYISTFFVANGQIYGWTLHNSKFAAFFGTLLKWAGQTLHYKPLPLPQATPTSIPVLV